MPKMMSLVWLQTARGLLLTISDSHMTSSNSGGFDVFVGACQSLFLPMFWRLWFPCVCALCKSIHAHVCMYTLHVRAHRDTQRHTDTHTLCVCNRDNMNPRVTWVATGRALEGGSSRTGTNPKSDYTVTLNQLIWNGTDLRRLFPAIGRVVSGVQGPREGSSFLFLPLEMIQGLMVV